MKNKKRLTYASLIGVSSVFACVVQATTVVTNNWNVTPWNVVAGPTLETFEVLPAWAINQVVNNDTGWTNRADRFWGQTEYPANKHLVFATDGITNTLSGAIIQPGMPIFIDMRCKLNPFDTTPPIEVNTVLSFYSDATSNLVVASYWKTNTTSFKVDPAVYYSILIRFASDKFDVFFNNDTAITSSLDATTNQLSKMVISGDGEMDDLYISYGNPLRTSTNSLAVLTGGAPTNAEESVIASWIANKNVAGSYTKDDAAKFYLTDTTPTTTTFTGQLGIGSFSYNPSTSNVTVVVTLKTDESTTKTGKINGILQLKGAGDYNTAKIGGWSAPLGATTILTNDFVNGVATYKFNLTGDANTNKFFLPIIVSDIK